MMAKGTRLCTRWLRWRDRCRYSRASSRATADQRSSRPSASTDQRARPTTVRWNPRGAHLTARAAYSGARNPWNATTCPGTTPSTSRRDRVRQPPGCHRPATTCGPIRRRLPRRAASGPASSRSGRAGITDRLPGPDRDRDGRRSVRPVRRFLGTVLGRVLAVLGTVLVRGPGPRPAPAVPSPGRRLDRARWPGPSSWSRSSGGSHRPGQVVRQPRRPAPGRPPQPGEPDASPSERRFAPITPSLRLPGLRRSAAPPAARLRAFDTGTPAGPQPVRQRCPVSASRPGQLVRHGPPDGDQVLDVDRRTTWASAAMAIASADGLRRPGRTPTAVCGDRPT